MSDHNVHFPVRLGRLLSVQAGCVRKLGTPGAPDPLHRTWKSAFFKEPVQGPVQVGALGLHGDQQADRKHHGGPDKALLMYSGDHFAAWRADYGLTDLSGGGFGENLTVTGLAEADVCIGDRLRVGSTLLEISQPRQPCSNINRRWERRGITQAVAANGRGGWYLRVIEPGALAAGDDVQLISRPHPKLTVALVNDARYGRSDDPHVFTALIACDALTDSFKRGLKARLAELSAAS